jgi:hypothetical protein
MASSYSVGGTTSSINKGHLTGLFDSTNDKFQRLMEDDLNDEYARIQREHDNLPTTSTAKTGVQQTHSALMAHVMHKRTQSKEMILKRQAGVRTSHNQLPSIDRKARVGSSGYVNGKNASSFIEVEDINSPLNDKDPFQRVNKFKNVGMA